MTVTELNEAPLLQTIELTDTSQLRARLYTFNDVLRADLRIFVFRKKEQEWVPTRRGVSVPADQLPELAQAVQALVEEESRCRARS
jgi:transcriptional coactivator p15 (PC4)